MSEAFFPDLYFRHDDVARMLGGMEPRDVIEAAKAREFGDGVWHRGKHYYIPRAGLNGYIEARRIFLASGDLKPIYARSGADLERKVVALRSHR
jgi:hypothetical protein